MDLTSENTEKVSDALDEIGVERDEKTVVLGILGWAKRMGDKYGSIVVDRRGNKYDWGQALCRERFGEQWQKYMQENNILMPNNSDFDRALEWENGFIPEWVFKYEENS